MKTKIFILSFFCISRVYAIDWDIPVYTDPTTTIALGTYSYYLKSEQKKTRKEQSKLKQTQELVFSQLVMVDNLQKKIYKGLEEVSGTIQNCMQVKQIYQDIRDCHRYTIEIKEIVSHHPQYAIFGVKAARKSYEQTLKIGTEISSLLTSSDTNLATAGDRYKILFELQDEIKKLKLWLMSISFSIDRAVKIGFWRSINPFQDYIDQDKDIVENIMYKFNYSL